jgi:O-antigen ligase
VTDVVSTAPCVTGGWLKHRSTATAVSIAVALAAAGLAVVSGSALGDGSKAAVVLPLAAGLGLMLSGLAATRFGAYVLVMLAIRSSIDLAKLSGSAAGTTEAASSRILDPASLLGVLFLGASILWLTGEYRRTRLPGSRLRLPLLCLVVTCAVSVLGGAHPSAGGLQAVRIATAVAMFVVLEQLAQRAGGPRHILLAVYASAIFPLAFTAVSFLGGTPRVEDKGALSRAIGPFNQSNEFGRYLMLLVVMGVALFPHLHGRLKLAMAAVLGSSTIFLLLTYTRTALIGTVIGVIVVGFFQNKRLLLGLVVAGILALVIVPGVSGRFTSLAPTEEAGLQDNSLGWRFTYWTEVLPLANKNPVTGIGLNETQYQTDAAKQPHNDFLRAYVETGLLGLGAYVIALGAMVALGLRAVRRTVTGTFERGAATGFLGAAVAFVAVSTVANVISNVVVLWYLFAYAAVASALIRAADTVPPPQTTQHPGPTPDPARPAFQSPQFANSEA